MPSESQLLRKAADHFVKADEQYEYHMNQAARIMNELRAIHGEPPVFYERANRESLGTERA
jgi:hypothetical protein